MLKFFRSLFSHRAFTSGAEAHAVGTVSLLVRLKAYSTLLHEPLARY
jgi:hypothetical protein